MSFRLQLSSQLNASIALRGAGVARALAFSPSGLHRALRRQPITPSSPIGYSRGLATLSYTNIQGAVDLERFQAVSKTLDLATIRFVRAQKLEEKLKESVQPFSLDDANSAVQPASTRPLTRTPNLVAWRTAKLKPGSLFKEGIPQIANSDKEVLIKLIAYLSERHPDVNLGKDTLLAYEGCDSGDPLPLSLSLLREKGVRNIKVFLTNGNNEKLLRAANIAAHLLRKEDVFFSIANAFDGVPTEARNYPEFQKIFLPFRLMITERPDKVSLFIQQRLEFMNPRDLGVASFLLDDEVARSTMQRYQFRREESESDGTSVFIKPINDRKLILSTDGVSAPEISDCAFTPKAIEAIFTRHQGRIIQMSKIATMTDEKRPINVIGVIFKK